MVFVPLQLLGAEGAEAGVGRTPPSLEGLDRLVHLVAVLDAGL